jgi:hypothetical protein
MSKDFRSSREWVFHFVESEGPEWVRSNYKRHTTEVRKDPVNRQRFNIYVSEALRKLNIEADKEVESTPGKTVVQKKVEGNNLTVTTKSLHIKTIEDLIQYSEVDMTEWKVASYESNSWEVSMGNKATGGKGPQTYTNYQVKAKFVPRVDPIKKVILDEFRKEALNYSPKFPKIKRDSSTKEGVLAEVSVPDLHFGQLSWAKETLDRDYDIKIAERMFVDAVEHLVSNVTRMYKVDHFLFPIGNDFFNVNSALNTTFRGTPQSEDDRGKKSFTNAWKMLVKVIEKMLSIADVTLLVIPGNHDYEKAYYLGEVLYAWFKDCENVTVDNSPSTKKYFLYGNSLIGFLHQIKKRKLNEYPLIMANDVPNLWNKAKFTEIHTGHLHKERMDEIQKTKIVSLPSLVSLSEWASNEGFNHLKEAQLQVWTKDNGKRSVLHYYPSEELYGK